MNATGQHPHRRRRRGFFAADTIIAMAVVLILTAVLVTTLTRQRRGTDRLAQSRAAVRLAEETLTALQGGLTPPAAPEGVTVEVVKSNGDARRPQGFEWVEVRVTREARTSTLSGLVRAGAAGAAGAAGGAVP